MPSLEIKSLRSRKRTRSRLHLSSIPTSLADDSSPSTEKPSLHPLTTTGPSSSSSDERRGHKSPASSISSSSLFEDEQWKRVVRLRERDGLRDTVWWGYILLGTTWAVFVFGMGGVSGIWEWSLMPIRSEQSTVIIKGDEALGMSGYYSSLMILTGAVVAWIWVVFNWVGMKYFRHN